MKPLRILLGNNTLSLLAGSETWTYTLACALKKLGHVVHIFSPELGIISQELEKEGVLCFDKIMKGGANPFSIVLEEGVDYEYDVIISNHNHIVEFLREQFPTTPIISTIHGVMHMMEHKGEQIKAPEYPALTAGVNQFVAVSEEVQAKLKRDYGLDSVIVRNFFDLTKLKIERKIAEKPSQFLLNTNYNGREDEEVKVIREVAKHYGAKMTAIGQNFSQTLDISKAINDADIVVGMGRSVLEGVAAGRLGIVHGRWGTGGVVSEGNIDTLRKVNFSGRNAAGDIWTKEKFIEEIDRHYPRSIEWAKDYIARDHNVVFAAQMYVEIARSLLNRGMAPKDQGLRPYKRAE